MSYQSCRLAGSLKFFYMWPLFQSHAKHLLFIIYHLYTEHTNINIEGISHTLYITFSCRYVDLEEAQAA